MMVNNFKGTVRPRNHNLLLDEDEYTDAREIKNEFLSESGGVSVVDDIPLEDKEAMDEFNFLNSEDGDWNPNREKIESMKNQLAQERRRKRPPRNPNVSETSSGTTLKTFYLGCKWGNKYGGLATEEFR